MPFNKPLPVWNNPGSEPLQAKKDAGWGVEEHPPADWFNWHWNRTYQALLELQQKSLHMDDPLPLSDATTTAKGIVMLEDSTASTSITKAATPKSVKTVKDSIPTLNNTVTSTSTTEAATANAVKTVNDSLVIHQADYVKHHGYGATANAANAYAITLSPAPTSYVDGMGVKIKVNADSTGISTLNVNNLGAKPLKNTVGNDVINLKANGMYTFIYNATTGNFILQGEGVDVAPLITSVNGILGM